jgi:hypothetical protein
MQVNTLILCSLAVSLNWFQGWEKFWSLSWKTVNLVRNRKLLKHDNWGPRVYTTISFSSTIPEPKKEQRSLFVTAWDFIRINIPKVRLEFCWNTYFVFLSEFTQFTWSSYYVLVDTKHISSAVINSLSTWFESKSNIKSYSAFHTYISPIRQVLGCMMAYLLPTFIIYVTLTFSVLL